MFPVVQSPEVEPGLNGKLKGSSWGLEEFIWVGKVYENLVLLPRIFHAVPFIVFKRVRERIFKNNNFRMVILREDGYI